MDKIDYLDRLNTEQRRAVEHIAGPTMVIAGAGSGKTRVLTYRVAHLIQNGVDPFQILALTFTNKAAREMRGRISAIVGDGPSKDIWMGTFHSVFAKILRVEAEKIGYPSNFTIYDTDDSKSLIRSIVKESGLDDKLYKAAFVYNRISAAKNSMVSPEDYQNNAEITEEDQRNGRPKLGEIYRLYCNRCFQAAAMDFDDLLYKTNELLERSPETLYKYQHKFKYILVDEYQDTNYTQYLIVKKLAALNENICVVGDDAQSIYAFRGANIQNILNFRKDYPDCELFKLEQNYRSTQNIVNAANEIIKNNSNQIKKEVWTENEEGEKIHVYRTLTDGEEGTLVANKIYEWQTTHQQTLNNFAILYRTNAQSRPLEEALRKLNLTYRVYGGLSFYQRKEIKDLLAYFRLTANPNDEEALKRIINYPARGIGNTTMEKVIIAAGENQKSLWHVLTHLENFPLKLNNGTRNKIGEFTTMIKSFSTQADDQNAYELGSQIASSTGILKELYVDKSPEGLSRYENIQELLNGLKEFSETENSDGSPRTMADFLIDVALLTDADAETEDRDHISLMTIHSAKGLEFPYVFLVGMEESLFPSQLALHSRQDLEEERRLFYVGLTRAQKQVVLSYAASRFRWGNRVHAEPSRFLEEIDPKFLLTNFAQGSMHRQRSKSIQQPLSNEARQQPKPIGRNMVKVATTPKEKEEVVDLEEIANTYQIEVGTTVEHQKFGKGKVVELSGSAGSVKATVFFPKHGKKQLLLKFAKLKVLHD